MVYIWCGKESGGEEAKRFIILQIALCFIMTEFSFPSLDLENITNRSLVWGGWNLNIVTDKGIQRTYLTAIKINHKMIRICKTDNYSLPQHLLFCVLGFVFNFVHSVNILCEILAICWLHKLLQSFWKMNHYHWWLTSPNWSEVSFMKNTLAKQMIQFI